MSLCDVFSRFVWLRPLQGKSSSEVAKELEAIYKEHGPPGVLQHDQGTEFKGHVKKLMEKLSVKVIQISPYHPQSQGKIESLHRQLKRRK